MRTKGHRAWFKKKQPSHSGRKKKCALKPSLDRRLERIFKEIGIPETKPFVPDPFQLEAVSTLESQDCLVVAPTGSGKTWIAQEAIKKALGRGEKTWYASPLKALSNSKFEEFSQLFGPDQVGIITGDRKENPDAPIIVGTTEILRNQLYDAMEAGMDIPIHLAVLDEVHYINDQERGVVWEEVLIYLPSRVRLLLLSATIGNSEEIASWLSEIRGAPCRVVESKNRPVPLFPLFLLPEGLLVPLMGKRGKLLKEVEMAMERTGSWKKRPDFSMIVEYLRHWNLLPAIFFLKSRADCDQALNLFHNGKKTMDEAFRRDLDKNLESFPFLRYHRQLKTLIENRVASHHGGQLPQWKLLVERMMDSGHLDAIFSTSTVAAGVNFPARTVVLVQSDRFNGQEFTDLTSTELHQMTGRAGRRGKDRIGFALVIPGLYQDPRLISDLLKSPPEPIRSQIRITFSMVLNLLLSHSMEAIRDLLYLSFGAYQERRNNIYFEERLKETKRELETLLPDGLCRTHEPEKVLGWIERYRSLKEKISILRKEAKKAAFEGELFSLLVPGRLFLHRNRAIYLTYKAIHSKEGPYCLAQKLTVKALRRRKTLRFKKVPIDRIQEILDYRIDIQEDMRPDELRELVENIPFDKLRPLDKWKDERKEGEIEIMEESLRALPCQNCPHRRKCGGLISYLKRVSSEIQMVKERLWRDFNRHLEFLKVTGFADIEGKLTPDGVWASQLRLDQPLLIAEAIRKGAFADKEPAIIASLVAPFVADKLKDIPVNDSEIDGMIELREAFEGMMRRIEGLMRLKESWGFDTPLIQYWPSVALYLWAKGRSWWDLLRTVPLEDGDMVSLIVRTADHLRQICSLERTHPDVARKAKAAISLIQREPAFT